MRILLVSANFQPHVGGIERFTEILADGLAGRGHEVTVLCCRSASAPLREQFGGFSVERIPASEILDGRLNVPYPLPNPRALLAAARRLLPAVDVIHVQDVLYATSFTMLALARRRGVASVLTQHVGFVPQSSRWLDTVERIAFATLGPFARLATAVATLNPAVAQWVERELHVCDARVLPVGIPPAASGAGDREQLRHSFGLPAERFVALFVGRDVPKKGLDVFLSAADPSYELVAVTDRAGKAATATLMPFMSPDRLQELLRCVDAFVLPSEGEGFPVSLQEALATGLPAVTTFQSGYDRFLSNDDVLFVERDASSVREALLRLVEDRSLRERLSQRSLAVAAQHFGVDRFVSAYESLYDEVFVRVARRG